MKKFYFLTFLILFVCFSVNGQFVFADDDATDAAYSDGFTNGDNGGTGFGAWSISTASGSGVFIGNPSNDGMGTTNIGTTAWGLFSTTSNPLTATRTFTGMELGDSFNFYWTMNFDTNSSGDFKGFVFKNSNDDIIFTVTNAGNAEIITTNGLAFSNYGTNPMQVNLLRNSSSGYSFLMTSRDGTEPIYQTTITSSEQIDRIEIFIDNADNLPQRNIYFNEFTYTHTNTFNITTATTYSKDLTGSGSLIKIGAETLTLSGTNSYSGTTTVSAGTLQLSSSLENSDITVESGATLQLSGDITLKSLTVNAGGIVTVDSGKTITITNDLTNNGSSFTINNGGGVIVSGTSTGEVTYNRTIGYNADITKGWYLISSPVAGELYDSSFFTANDLATNGTNVAFALYNTGSDNWTYIQDTGSGSIINAQGYSVKKGTSSGDISFTGTLRTATTSIVALTGGNGSYNLIGNPFAAYYESTVFIVDNTANLTSNQIWIWNSSTENYEVKPFIDGFLLAPAQGFFISASSIGLVSFNPAVQRTSTTDTFQKTRSNKREIHLLVNSDLEPERFAKIYYINGATTGFDNGYDGETFGAQANKIDVFTHLVSDSQGKNYQIQSLPDENYSDMIVPVGVKATAGSKVTFSTKTIDLPEGYKVYLEDKETGDFIRLDETDSKYEVTFTNSVNGIGRFFLHTSSSVLSTPETAISKENINAYRLNSNTLRITGLNEGEANLSLYNTLGKEILTNKIKGKTINDVTLPNLTNGVYIVELTTSKGKYSKKIIM